MIRGGKRQSEAHNVPTSERAASIDGSQNDRHDADYAVGTSGHAAARWKRPAQVSDARR